MPQISLRVKSTKGTFTDTFSTSNKGEKIVETAIHRQKLDSHPPLPYLLKRGADGVTLDQSKKIESYALSDGSLVIVQAPEAEDG